MMAGGAQPFPASRRPDFQLCLAPAPTAGPVHEEDEKQMGLAWAEPSGRFQTVNFTMADFDPFKPTA